MIGGGLEGGDMAWRERGNYEFELVKVSISVEDMRGLSGRQMLLSA